jgi:hypothetical protein
VQVAVDIDSEKFDEGIEKLGMLPGCNIDRLEVIAPLFQLANHRGHLDDFRACAEYGEDLLFACMGSHCVL